MTAGQRIKICLALVSPSTIAAFHCWTAANFCQIFKPESNRYDLRSLFIAKPRRNICYLAPEPTKPTCSWVLSRFICTNNKATWHKSMTADTRGLSARHDAALWERVITKVNAAKVQPAASRLQRRRENADDPGGGCRLWFVLSSSPTCPVSPPSFYDSGLFLQCRLRYACGGFTAAQGILEKAGRAFSFAFTFLNGERLRPLKARCPKTEFTLFPFFSLSVDALI